MTNSSRIPPWPLGNTLDRRIGSPRPLLFICQELGHLAELKRVMRHLEAVFPRIVLAVDVAPSNSHRVGLIAGLNECRVRGVHCVDLAGQSLGPDGVPMGEAPPPAIDPRVFAAAGAAFAPLRRSFPPEVFAHLEGCVHTILQRQAVATALAERVEPGLVVMAEDSLEHQSGAFIKVFRERGVRTIIVPFTLPSPIEVAEASPPIVVGDPLTSLIATQYPRWVFEYKGVKRLRLGPIDILARELLGVAPPQPWVYNSGSAAAIALESAAMGSLYTTFGFPPAQLAVVGSSVDDLMFEGLKEKASWKRLLCEELGADERKPLLVWAVLPDQFHQRHRSVPEYGSYHEVVDYIAGELARFSSMYTVVARLHPRTAEADVVPILAARGVSHSRWPTERVVPLSELYVATSSATLRWAVACGVPAINYDLYQYDFMENLNQVRGVVRVTSKRDFAERVHRFTYDSEYRRSLEEAQRCAAPEWGVLDGRSGERLKQLCLEHTCAAQPG
jgi:hypothetical protein